MSCKIDDLQRENSLMEKQIEEINHFVPSVFDVPPDFIFQILNWMKEHPESVLNRRADEKQW